MRLEPVRAPDALHRADAHACRLIGHRRAGPVRLFTRRRLHGQRGDALGERSGEFGMREGRVLSCKSPSTPSAAKRSCQRQTQIFDLPASRMIAFVSTPSALSSTSCTLHTCFCGALRSLTKARSRSTSAGVTEREMPLRTDSHAASLPGISTRIQMSDFIHSHVRRFKLQARIFFCSRSSVFKSTVVRQGKRHDHENDG